MEGIIAASPAKSVFLRQLKKRHHGGASLEAPLEAMVKALLDLGIESLDAAKGSYHNGVEDILASQGFESSIISLLRPAINEQSNSDELGEFGPIFTDPETYEVPEFGKMGVNWGGGDASVQIEECLSPVHRGFGPLQGRLNERQLGLNRGIQGHSVGDEAEGDSSGYDALIFAFFAFSERLDTWLFHHPARSILKGAAKESQGKHG